MIRDLLRNETRGHRNWQLRTRGARTRESGTGAGTWESRTGAGTTGTGAETGESETRAGTMGTGAGTRESRIRETGTGSTGRCASGADAMVSGANSGKMAALAEDVGSFLLKASSPRRVSDAFSNSIGGEVCVKVAKSPQSCVRNGAASRELCTTRSSITC